MRRCGARNGNGMLAARRRIRGLGVRGEAGAAAWTTRVVPRQTLRAAGERAGPAGLTAASGPGGLGPTALQTSYARIACPPNPDPLAALRSPGSPCHPSTYEPHRLSPTSSAREGIPAQPAIRSHLAFRRSHRASLASRAYSVVCISYHGLSLLLQPYSQGPAKIQPPPTFQTSVLSALRTGPVLVHWVPLAHVNPAQVVKIVQLYPFLKVHLKCRLLQKVF